MQDLSQIQKPNYDIIFDDILKAEPNLKSLIDYVRQIPNPTQKDYKQLLLDIKSDNDEVIQSVFSQLMNRYIKVAINVAYKYSAKHGTPLDETVQYALMELVELCDEYIEKNKIVDNYSHIINTYGSLYAYVCQSILRKLEAEESILLNLPPRETICSILRNREKNLQEQTKHIEKDNALKAEESISMLEEKILSLQKQMNVLNDLALNLEIDYRNAFEKILTEQKRWYIFYDFSELKECAKIVLSKYKQILTQFNMTEIGFIRKISNSERIYTSQDIYSVSQYLINILNERILKLIDAINEKIFGYECRIEDIRERVILKEREQVNKISTLMGEITLYTQLLLPAYSIEEIIENDQEVELGMCDESLEAIVSHNLLKEQLISVLSTLTPREEKVLRLRFGLDDGSARTLEEVGKEFYLDRERIRQIEAKALRKLRHPSRSKKIKDYLD